MDKIQRSIGLDIVRSLAVCFVIAVHFSLNTSFYSTPINNLGMSFQELLRICFMTCVPLFMMLTGFLNGKKVISLDYYKGIWRIIETYLIFSLVAIVFRTYYLHEKFSIVEWFVKFLRFNANEYGWYVEMYIGLFLIIPFLNILYQNIPEQKQKQILILILGLMTLNSNRLFGFDILPAFWKGAYPITLYFIGCYIKEFNPKIDKKLGLLLILLLISIGTGLSFLLNQSLVYFYFNSPIVMAMAVILFLLLYEVDFQNNAFRWIVSKLSLLSLDIYLISYIFDKVYYPYFKEKYFFSQEQFYIYFPILFFLVLGSSFVIAFLKNEIRNKIS